MSAWSRFINLWRGRSLQRDLGDELKFHREMQIERNLERGMNPRDADRQARRHFGSVLRAQEGMREARVMMWVESLAADIRYGARLLRRRAGLAAMAIVTLSLGIPRLSNSAAGRPGYRDRRCGRPPPRGGHQRNDGAAALAG